MTPAVTESVARDAARGVLDHPGTDAVEVVVAGSDTGLTRYANSEITQNTVRQEVRAHVRVAVGNRVAAAATNQLDADHMRAATDRALAAAKASRPDEDFPGLPHPSEVGRPVAVVRFDDATAGVSPRRRADLVAEVLDATGSTNAAGIYETSSHVFGVYSSTGVECFDSFTRCMVTCLVDDGTATGWAEGSSHSIDGIDAAEVGRRAARKAELGHKTVECEPGSYEVVLEPSAVATMIEYLSYMGFGAKQVIDGESFLTSKAQSDVAAGSVTISDDAFHPLSIGIGFDFEGVPRKEVRVIDRGRATGPVTDLRTSKKLGLEVTGHHSGSNEFGPYAANVVLHPGRASTDELVSEVSDGILVTRFHYVNVLDRPATLLTGMTRDGTFRISKGEVVGAVHNFRFTQNVLAALAAVEGIGSGARTFAPDWGSFGSTVAPALRIASFDFTSKTTH